VAPDPERLLDGLNAAQREAVVATSGPVAILAGAGSGKTRVISHRVAYAVATGAVDPAHVLVVTFTDKAATEMVDRLRRLGLGSVTARTFHAHALTQLRHFWPSHHDGGALPEVLDSKLAILVPLARQLPGGYRFAAPKDLADEIEWAKSRRVPPERYSQEAEEAGRRPPIPERLMARIYRDYERTKQRSNRIDFDDMLGLTVELLETDPAAAALVRERKRWFSVDEYQDTNPLQERLLELWLGERPAPDVCVVGDEDQTIYSFNGATSDFLTGFAGRHPDARVFALTDNYRSTPEILAVANRLIAATGRAKRLSATSPSGPPPTITRFADAAAELRGLVEGIRRHLGSGIEPSGIAVLVRINAQLPDIEQALTRAGVAYRIRGERFFARRDVRAAIELVRRSRSAETGPALATDVRSLWRDRLGHEEGANPDGSEARERQAALDTLLALVDDAVAGTPALGVAELVVELERRDATEAAGQGNGVELLTYHRAKGLEWDAVFLPMLEEGTLPIRQALDDPAALAEERRLLYVGITRARTHLALSWAHRRRSSEPSRFLLDLRLAAAVVPVAARPSPVLRRASESRGPAPVPVDPLFDALRAWRAERARADGVPAYVVAHDSTLVAIAEARPRSLEFLALVKGLGPTKLDRYGADILAVVGRAKAS
jgi:DNA helicase-2/ATP-dependent DNA helicase PcrA